MNRPRIRHLGTHDHLRAAVVVGFVLMVPSYAAMSCGRREMSNPQAVPLQAIADTIFARHRDVSCRGENDVRVIAGFEDRDVKASACFGNLGDTSSYVYRDRSGRIVLVGRYFSLRQEKIAAVSDSVLAALSRAYGTPRRCPPKPLLQSALVRQYAWPNPDYMVQMWADSIGISASLGVEVQLGESFCGEPVRLPPFFLHDADKLDPQDTLRPAGPHRRQRIRDPRAPAP